MAKINPVMKHVKKPLTKEQVAIEDFLNAIPPEVVVTGDGIINNAIHEDLVIPETTLDPIVDSVVAADQLDELASDVDGVTSVASMESYARIFQQLTSASGHPVASLESFPATKGGVKRLAKAIRGHASDIRGGVTLAFEEFASGVEESIGTSMSNYKQALGKLNQVREDDFASESDIVINYKQFWQLFHMNDELMSLKDFKLEVEGVKKLASLIKDGKDSIVQWSRGDDSLGNAIPGSEFIQLMNNTDVTIKDGRGRWVVESVKSPKNNEGNWTAGDWFWIFVFNWAGLVYRIVKGGSGTDEAKREQSLKAVHSVIGEMKRMAPIAKEIEDCVTEIINVANKAKPDRQADLKRAASPVLELAAKTVEHITQITYGAMKLFDQAENSSNRSNR